MAPCGAVTEAAAVWLGVMCFCLFVYVCDVRCVQQLFRCMVAASCAAVAAVTAVCLLVGDGRDDNAHQCAKGVCHFGCSVNVFATPTMQLCVRVAWKQPSTGCQREVCGGLSMHQT
jgi:hypothetical protein